MKAIIKASQEVRFLGLKDYFLRAIRWVEYKKVLAEPLVTRLFRLDEAKEAFEAFHKGETVKVLFEI